MRLILALALLLALPSCRLGATPPPPLRSQPQIGDAPMAPAPADCEAARYAPLLGQPRSALDSLALPERTRVIAPNSAVTMDYSPQRLNIDLNTQGRITRIHCG
jgi:hypothetical protein